MNIEAIEQKESENHEYVHETEKTNQPQDVRKFTMDYSPIAREELAHKIKIIKIRSELGLVNKDEGQFSVHKLRNEFKTRFSRQKEVFDMESKNIRDVETVSKEKGVIFIHSIPLYSDEQANTQMNNNVVRTDEMSVLDRIGMLQHEHPTVSCSTVKLNSKGKEYGFDPNTAKTMYSLGVVIGQGTIMSAHLYDGGIRTLSTTARERKYDAHEKDTTIQPNIIAQVEYAIEGPFSKEYEKKFEQEHGNVEKGSNTGRGDYNELSVAIKSIDGFYIDSEFIDFEEGSYSTRRKDINNIFAQFPDVPIYIKRHGSVQKYVWKTEGLQPVEIAGTFERNKPTKKLDNYEFPYAAHTKLEHKNSVYSKEYGVDFFEAEQLSVILDKFSEPKTIQRKRLRYSNKIAEIIVDILAKHPEIRDDIVASIRDDFKRANNDIQSVRDSMKDSAAKKDDYTVLGRGSYFKSLGEDKMKTYNILVGLAEELEKKGLAGIKDELLRAVRS